MVDPSPAPFTGSPEIASLRREMQIGFESIRAAQRDSIEEMTRMFQAFLEMSLKAARKDAYEEAVKICEKVAEGADYHYASAARECARGIKERAQ